MPIPDFNSNLVLPPHLGDPRQRHELSPYPCTTLEICQKFATSRERVRILTGFLDFRSRLQQINVLQGFQWLDGSFMENIELRESRPPKDLDLRPSLVEFRTIGRGSFCRRRRYSSVE